MKIDRPGNNRAIVCLCLNFAASSVRAGFFSRGEMKSAATLFKYIEGCKYIKYYSASQTWRTKERIAIKEKLLTAQD